MSHDTTNHSRMAATFALGTGYALPRGGLSKRRNNEQPIVSSVDSSLAKTLVAMLKFPMSTPSTSFKAAACGSTRAFKRDF
ncbi:hypothetical protein KKY68_06720 [Pseudomonas aeruginosa]|nr:hypothetical protein KKY68_06720 [Pseudomonas aeruginosa]